MLVLVLQSVVSLITICMLVTFMLLNIPSRPQRTKVHELGANMSTRATLDLSVVLLMPILEVDESNP